MDKSKIKSFAVWARRKMIESVTEKAERIGIKEDNILKGEKIQGGFRVEGIDEIFYMPFEHREALIAQIKEKGYKEVMEEAAYTWFNRFIGLRYMEVNDYLPSKIRILSSEVEGKTEPDVLSNIPAVCEELNLDAETLYQLLDTGRTEDREKAYKIILVKQCNELGKIIPQMFEKISDYTELLIPDNLLEEGAVIRKLAEDIDESDWKEEVEIIGWIYQYYILEKKQSIDSYVEQGKKVVKEDLPAKTQIFTPSWIVKYMVENSLGRLWLEGHPNTDLQAEWKYYLEEAEQEPDVEEELKKIREEHSRLIPEDIKVLDPCMGSGHILVYAFEVLYEIYKTAGYSERDIPRLILKNNLYGLDIDDRALQLASFALIMKARHYNRRLFREIEKNELELNLCSIQESNILKEEAIDYFVKGNRTLKNDVKYLVDIFRDAKDYGSMLEIKKIDYKAINTELASLKHNTNLMFADYKKIICDIVPKLINQYRLMVQKYDVCITNPPYLGRGNVNEDLLKVMDKKYPDSKSDLFAIFIERGFNFIKNNGYNVLVTMQSWMFLSSYENLRRKLLSDYQLLSFIHMDNMVMRIAFGTCAFVFRKSSVNYNAVFQKIKYKDINKDEQPENFPSNYIYEINSKEFLKAEGAPINYWISPKMRNIFNTYAMLGNISEPRQGMASGNNNKFIRIWSEVDLNKIGFGYKSYGDFLKSENLYAPINKGGDYRKWYGNNENVVKFNKKNFELLSKQGNKLPSRDFYFKKGMTWGKISSGKFSSRFCPYGYVFSDAGMKITIDDDKIGILGALVNSKLANLFLSAISETVNYEKGNISRIPVPILNAEGGQQINEMFKYCIEYSKSDWDSFETSWDFKLHPLLKMKRKYNFNKISDSFDELDKEWNDNFDQLKANEEELNRIFIDIYELQDELTPEEEDKDITIRKADRERDIKSFISYAVGCMFGRYSLDAEGLIYAGGDFADKWNITDKKVRNIVRDEEGNVVSDTWTNASYIPDADNIIPVTDDEYFEDDIVARFIEFVKNVYGDETLDDNLDYIADAIGRKSSETAKQCIRRYFLKDFYKDHLKIYQKRPIYWMFDSGKNDGFKCLIYMHRYNEQTVAKVRTDYLHMLQRKYEAQINVQQLTLDSANSTAKDKTIAKKKIDKISKQIHECMEYDQVVSFIANECIAIDLDDGVKVNYAKFQGIGVINSKGKEEKMNLLAKI